MQIYGINPVLEAVRARRVRIIRVAARSDERLGALLELARDQRCLLYTSPSPRDS